MATAVKHVRDWLAALTLRIQPSMRPEDLAGRLAVLAEDLAEEFPVDAFCRASLLHVAKQCPRYWPSFGEVCEALSAWRRESRLTFGMLLSDHRAYEPPPVVPERTPEELNHVTRLTNEVVAALKHHEIEKQAAYQRSVPQHPPAPEMTRAQLNEAYRRAGVKGPQLPEPKPNVVPIRPAATPMHSETKRGPVVDDDEHSD